MRLLDQVAQVAAPLVIIDRTGPHAMPAAAECAAAVAACPLRYVLDAGASNLCRDARLRAMATAATARLPATRFWAEWTETDGRRTGVMVDADIDGRSGSIETFWEQAGAEPDRAQAAVAFDLDRAIAACADWNTSFALAPFAHPLARHLLFRVDPRWTRHFGREGPDAAARALQTVVSNLVPACETLLAWRC